MQVPILNSRRHSFPLASAERTGRSARDAILAVTLLSIAFLQGFNRLAAQTAPPSDRIYPTLYPMPSGWFGIDRGPETDRLLLYDSALNERGQTQWFELHPLDFATLPEPWGDSVALLLARPAGATVLFRVRTRPTPELTPIWQTTGSGYERIAAVRNSVLQASPEALLAGDSGLTSIRLDGTQNFSRPVRVLRILASGPNELIAVERSGSAISVSWIDPGTGNLLAARPLDSGGDVLGAVHRIGPDATNLIVVTSDPPTLFRFRKESRGFLERVSLPEFPDALVTLPTGTEAALIFREYPAPRAMIVGSQILSEQRLYYPHRDVYAHQLEAGPYVMLVGHDSAAVYDRSLDYMGSIPAAGGANPRLIPLDASQDRYLLATDQGSRIVEIREESLLWLRRSWPWILAGALAIVLLVTGRSAYRRFRFVRAVYANLVQAPGSAGVVVASGRGRVLQVNHSARLFLGVASPVPLGRHISSYLQSEELRPVLDSIRRLLATGEPFEIELGRTVNGGQRTLRFQGRIMYGRYGGASGYILLIEDITASLERDRLVNWASVAHHIAHEMKTPLGTVRTTAELMRESVARHPEPERMAPAVQRIIRQSIRLREIVDDLLTVARTESLNRMETNLSLLFSSLIDEFSEYVPSTIRLRYETRGGDFRAMVDPDQLTIAVRNLLDNARQAIGERESGQIRLTLHGEPERVRIVVEDNGIGMSRTTLDRLFQPYYTEKEGGSGIGTVIVRRVVEGHGGSVEVESEQGVGTTFVLKIPRE